MSWTLTKKFDTLASPGEIRRREVSWTLTKKFDTSASPGEIRRREVSWTLTKKFDTSASPGEIRRREVSWTLTKKFDTSASPGEIKKREVDTSASPGEIKKREVVLDPPASPEEIKSLLPQLFVFVTLFHTAVETATVWYTSCCTMLSGHHLNILLFWWRSTAFLVFWVGACTLSPPTPHPHPCP